MWYKISVICLLFFCGGCSIQPLYEFEDESDYQKNIRVDVIFGKNGQKLRGYLQDLIRDLDISDENYTLSVTLTENDVPYALADDYNAQRLRINLIANVVLKDSKGKEIVSAYISESTTRNIASAQGDVLLSMYDKVNGSMLKNLAFRIVENLRVALRK